MSFKTTCFLFFISAGVIMSGCVKKGHWERTSFATVPFEQAEAECQFEGDKALQNSQYRLQSNIFIMGADKARVYESCMRAKGFVGVYDD